MSEEHLFRSALPTQINIPFLETLSLRTIIILENIDVADIDPNVLSYIQENSIEFIHICENVGSVQVEMRESIFCWHLFPLSVK